MDGINLEDMDILDLVDDDNPEWTNAARGEPQRCCKCKHKLSKSHFMDPKTPREPLSNITNYRPPKVRKQCNRCRDMLRPTVQRQSQKKRDKRDQFLHETYGTILPWREVKARMFERWGYCSILADYRWRETDQIFGITGIIGRFRVASEDMNRDIAEYLLDEIHRGQPKFAEDVERNGEQVVWEHHDGYRFVFQKRDRITENSRKLPQSFIHAPYITYRCSQAKRRAQKSRDGPFHTQRNKQSMHYQPCQGSLTFYFPPNGRVTFDDGAEVFVELHHWPHMGRINAFGVPKVIRQWIRDNLRPDAKIQRDDLLRAIRERTIPDCDLDEENVYLSPAHVKYWWNKFREQEGRISDNPYVNMQHALSQDPKVTPYRHKVLTFRTRELFSMQSLVHI